MPLVHRFLFISRLALGFAAAGLGLSAQTTTYSDWLPTVFSEADRYNNAVIGASADPDQDGLRNLQEFVFFGQPLSADSAALLPRLEQVGSDLTLTFRQRQGISDVDIRLQGSDTLTSWITYNTLTEVGRVAFSGYDEVTLLDPQPFSNAAAARRFLRLRLETPVPANLRAPVQLSIGVAPAAPQSWTVNWTDPNGFETGHRIERRLLADGTWQEVGSTAADTGAFTHTTADYQQSLTYRVSALASGGRIATSSPVSLPDTDGDGIPDALELQTAYTGVEGTFASDPNSFSSNGSGVSDGWQAGNGYNPAASFNGEMDSDGDGLSDYEEYKLGTNPRKKDSDDDGIEDPLDGWAMVSALAPARLEAPSYALMPIGPAGSYSTEINNKGQALIKNLNGSWSLLNGGVTSPLQAPPGRSLASVYELRDDGGLLAATESSDMNPLTVNTWKRSVTGAWIECAVPQSLADIAGSSFEGYFVSAEALGPDGIVYGSAATGVYGSLGVYASIFGAYSWNNGSVEKIGDQLGYTYGETLNGFLSTYTSDIMWLSPTLLYHYAADGSTFGMIKVNDKNIKISKKDTYNGSYVFRTWSGDSTTGGTENHSLVVNFGEAELFEFSNGGSLDAFAINNRNTVILAQQDGQSVLWLDTNGGLLNDQPVDGNPAFARLDWKTNFGEAPPLTLNAQMRGFDQTRIWQNAQWLDLAPLVPATQGQNAPWGNVYIADQNDSGMLVGSARKTADNQTYAVLLLPVELTSADRLIKGAITIPEGWSNVSLGFRSTAQSGLDLGTFPGLEPGLTDSPTYIYASADDILSEAELTKAQGGTLDPRANNQAVVFYRDTTDPRKLHFATAFDQLGEIEIALSFGSGPTPAVGKVTHTLTAQTETSGLIATLDQRIETMTIPEVRDFDLDTDGDGVPDGGPLDLVTASQPGTMETPGAYVSEAAEDDPLNLVLLVNSDDDNADGLADSFNPQLSATDDDLARIVLRPPSILTSPVGTLTLTHTGGPALRLRFATGPPVASGTSVNLASPAGPLAALATGPVTLYAEGLAPASVVAITLTYTPPTGGAVSDTVKLTVIDPASLAALQTAHRYFVQKTGDLSGLVSRTYAANGAYHQYRLGLSPIGDELPIQNRNLLTKTVLGSIGMIKNRAAFYRGVADGFWFGLKSDWEMVKNPVGTLQSSGQIVYVVTNPVSAAITLWFSEDADGRMARALAISRQINEIEVALAGKSAAQIATMARDMAETIARDLYTDAEASLGWAPITTGLDLQVVNYMAGTTTGFIAEQVAVGLASGTAAAKVSAKIGPVIKGVLAAATSGERYSLSILSASEKAVAKLQHNLVRMAANEAEVRAATQAAQKVKAIELPGGLRVPQIIDNWFTPKPQLYQDVLKIWRDKLPVNVSGERLANMANDLAAVLYRFGNNPPLADDAIKGFAHLQPRLFKVGEDNLSRWLDVEKFFGGLNTPAKRIALQESLIAYKQAVELNPAAKFWIKNIDDISPKAYRYVTQSDLDLMASNGGKLPAHNGNGWYCTFDQYNDAVSAKQKLQLPDDLNYVARVEINTSGVRNNCRIAKGTRELDPHLEAITRDFPALGQGNGTQFLIDGVEITPSAIHYF